VKTPPRAQAGFTYLEMIATAAILMILASAVMPVAKITYKRKKEIELQRSLRTLRRAIDEFNLMARQGRIAPTDIKVGSENYPEDLEILVKGASLVGVVDTSKKAKFLRKIPIDPMTNSTEWGLRCYQDEPDSTSWCGDNVYDVYTKSTAKALDGKTKYKDW
jgi:general secretion pathway protein G